MTTAAPPILCRFGRDEVEELQRPDWEPRFSCPYRFFHNLRPGESWWDRPEADPAKASQTFVVQPESPPIPPDVAAFWADGTITLRELKLHRKDRLGEKQHRAADVLRELIGSRLDLKLISWGQSFIDGAAPAGAARDQP